MKKIVSLLLVLVMALGSLSLSCFAVEEEKDVFDINNYTDRELDLTNYTLDDLSEMTATTALSRFSQLNTRLRR